MSKYPLHDLIQKEISFDTFKQEIMNLKAHINEQSETGDTPLHLTRNIDLIQLLLSMGANPNIKNYSKNRIPMTEHLDKDINRSKQYEITMILLKAGSNINDIDSWGNTPLHYSLSHDNNDIFLILIKKSAKHVTNNAGHTLLDFAKMYNHPSAESRLTI